MTKDHPRKEPGMSKSLEMLAERCEKATGADRELSAAIALAVHDYLHEVEGNKPLNCRVRNNLGAPIYIGGETGRSMDYTASLDAAMTLVPEGLCWRLGVNGNPKAKLLGGSAAAILGDDFGTDISKAGAATPALALTAAALRARSQSAGGGTE